MKNIESLVFGGGCFWCVEALFQRVAGVKTVTSGYTGGTKDNPSYEEVCSGLYGHIEVVKIEYDKTEVDIEELLRIFFLSHDPTSKDKQGHDEGVQYRSAIFYTNEEQKNYITTYISKVTNEKVYPNKILTEVRPLAKFFEAETNHANYYNLHKDAPYCAYIIAPKLEKMTPLEANTRGINT